MKRLAVSCIAFLSLLLLFSCAKAPADGKLVVYAYDSFTAEWGPAPALAKLFKEKTGIDVEFVSAGDAGQTLARVIDERKRNVADVVVGIDGNLSKRAIDSGVLVAYKPAGAEKIDAAFALDPKWRLTPFDWGCFAIVWDSEKLATPPASLEDLAKPEYAGKLVIMDPRTSTPGLGFLGWTLAAYGDSAADYWKRLRPSVLTMTDGWDSGYGMMVAGEVPLVVSYTTSPAYHVEYDKTERYKALLFSEGHPVQVECVGIVAGTKRMKSAKAFVDFMISPEAQAILPTTQWMYPVDSSVALPESYKAAPKPAKLLEARIEIPQASIDACLEALGAK